MDPPPRGLHLQTMFQKEFVTKAAKIYRTYYKETGQQQTYLYPAIKELPFIN